MKSSTNIVNQQLTPTKINEKDISKSGKLGNGLTSDVYYGVWHSQVVAIKEYKIEKDKEYRLEYFESEKHILNLLTFKNENEYIIKFHGYIEDEIQHSLVIEYMDTCLFDYLRYESEVNKLLPIQDILMYANKIAHGLECLHRYDIIYRDLKCENILVNYADKKVKLADFGFSIFKKDVYKQMDLCGSLFFIAPELASANRIALQSNIPYSEKSDMYAYAIVLYFISELKAPYDSDLKAIEVFKLLLKNIRPEIKTSSLFVSNLIKRCWDENPDERPTASEVIEEIKNESNKLKI